MASEKKIENPTGFYQDRFAFQQAFNFTSRPVDFFDIGNFKAFWVYSKVASNSRVLDLGCGSGRLACLKSKGCRLTGIDFSAKALEIAREMNGYDEVFQGDVLSYRGAGQSFDYIVSLDVFGHIPFTDKDRVIGHLKSFLKPGGVMIHGIECGIIDYAALAAEDWERIVHTDGHVGIESKTAAIDRFRRFFEHVRGDVRFNVVAGVADYLKYDAMFPGRLDPDLLQYLRCMDQFERKAFDLCAGLTLIKMENNRMRSSDDAEGFLLLQASDRVLPAVAMTLPGRRLDRDAVDLADDTVFLKGWYQPEKTDQGLFRWAQRRAYLVLDRCAKQRLRLTVFTSYPLVSKKPVTLYFRTKESGRTLAEATLSSHEPVVVTVPIEEPRGIVEIFTDLAWVPNLFDGGEDNRELAFGVRAAELV